MARAVRLHLSRMAALGWEADHWLVGSVLPFNAYIAAGTRVERGAVSRPKAFIAFGVQFNFAVCSPSNRYARFLIVRCRRASSEIPIWHPPRPDDDDNVWNAAHHKSLDLSYALAVRGNAP